MAHRVRLRTGCEKTCWPCSAHWDNWDMVVLCHLERAIHLASSQSDLEAVTTPVPRAAPGVRAVEPRDLRSPPLWALCSRPQNADGVSEVPTLLPESGPEPRGAGEGATGP